MSEELPGGVLAVLDIPEKEMEDQLLYLEKFNSGFPYRVFYNLMGKDQFWEFLDVFSGSRLDFPKKQNLVKGISYVKIYTFCRERNFTEESKRRAAQVFKKKLVSVQRIVAYMRKEFNNE